ncbi:MAG TPA: beta-galactosidase [Candidatus Saccharimonadales bacterium]|nr:beta-galactosidase [Candidatus Saccharimonadales bacterium]
MSKSVTVKNIGWSPVNWLKVLAHYAWRGGFWRKFLSLFIAIVILVTGVFYGIAEWYIHKHSSEPLVIGTTFIPDYAQSFGLDSKQTLEAILGDLKIRQVRLVSYWSETESTPGTYDFSMLDWQFAMANKYGAKVSLAIGLRQPRWPECHEPSWINIDSKNKPSWQPQLYKYMNAVIERYKNNPALQDYELENEFFMKVFGECKDFDRSRLVSEFQMVKKADSRHPVIVSRSDNWIGIPVGKPTPDQFAISVYKRVWDATFTHRYFEYPLPPWFYAALAGSEELLSGKDMIIHELQAEPWTPNGKLITEISVKEQFKSMNPDRMKKRIKYGQDTGMRTIDLWGAEWWYWLKQTQHDPSVWNVVKEGVAQAQVDNQKLAKNN